MQGGPELLQGLILVRASSDFHHEDEQAFLFGRIRGTALVSGRQVVDAGFFGVFEQLIVHRALAIP